MSVFNTDALLGQRHAEEIDTSFHLCPEGEYAMQIDDLTLREVKSERVEGVWAGLDIHWEIKDDDVRQVMNMDKVRVQQSMLINLVMNGGQPVIPVRIDWGINQNMDLKRVMEATGVKKTNFAISDLKYATAWGRVQHETVKDKDGNTVTNADGSTQKRARVTRVAPLSQGQRR